MTYVKHIQRKDEARAQKEKDKSSDYAHLFAVDLQNVLLSPFIQASSLYYNMKLCVHNFTFYNLKNNVGICYVWHKAEGGLSSHEFATIICNFIKIKQE